MEKESSSKVASTSQSFEQLIDVRQEDIDELGHVNNTVYLHWVQEIATLHWQFLAPEEDQLNLLWVVSRHEIDYKEAAMLGDQIKVITWIGPSSGLTFERNTAIYRAADQKLLAQALTLWVPINRESRKPQRLRPELRRLFSS